MAFTFAACSLATNSSTTRCVWNRVRACYLQTERERLINEREFRRISAHALSLKGVGWAPDGKTSRPKTLIFPLTPNAIFSTPAVDSALWGQKGPTGINAVNPALITAAVTTVAATLSRAHSCRSSRRSDCEGPELRVALNWWLFLLSSVRASRPRYSFLTSMWTEVRHFWTWVGLLDEYSKKHSLDFNSSVLRTQLREREGMRFLF